jgi:hypothetical protein
MRIEPFHALVPLAALLAASVPVPVGPDYSVIDGDSEPLRATFNADVGKVRVLMLVAPT